jgi:YfiR/HmsC-like
MVRKASKSLALFLLSSSLIGAEADQRAGEYQVKAAFLYNFAKFVTWPPAAERADQPFVIGILGDDPFGDTLDQMIVDRAIRGRKVAVRRFTAAGDALAHCQLLFVSTSEADQLTAILKVAARANVLTVSDLDRFTERGGMIGFHIEDKRVRFDINVAAAESAGLAMSSQLLKLARSVVGPQRPRE